MKMRFAAAAVTASVVLIGPAWGQAFESQTYTIPTDPNGQYQYEPPSKKGKLVVLISKRTGKSGTNFSRREIDCQAETFRYTGEGDTYEQMLSGKPAGKMADLVRGSVSSYAAYWACNHPAVKAKQPKPAGK